MSVTKYLELYSGNRNRLLYPSQSTYEVPLCSYLQKNNDDQDLVIDSAVYYYFSKYGFINGAGDSFQIYGKFQQGTTPIDIYLDPNMTYSNGNMAYSLTEDFFKGYKITTYYDPNINSEAYIISYDPKTGLCKTDIPLPGADVSNLYGYIISSSVTELRGKLTLPTTDDNNNFINKNIGAYTNYYLIFESPGNYSNQYNSNIFYRKIQYYNNFYQTAYFDLVIPYPYPSFGNIKPFDFSIRKSLPLERWTLPTSTYFNRIPPLNPIIGPHIGPVITLPEGASTVDNYYTGKYVYLYNNPAYTYPGIYPQPENSLSLISENIFYPVYGLYYIKSYNAETRQLSVSTNRSKYIDIEYPNYDGILYNQKYFIPLTGCSVETKTGENSLYVTFDNTVPSHCGSLELFPYYFTVGNTYKFVWDLKDISIGDESKETELTIRDNGNIVYNTTISNTTITNLNFSITPITTNITFEFCYFPLDLTKLYQLEFINMSVNSIYYNSSSFSAVYGITSIEQLNQYNTTSYKALLNGIGSPLTSSLQLSPVLTPVHTFNVCWCIRSVGDFVGEVKCDIIQIDPYTNVLSPPINKVLYSFYITNDYVYYNFSINPVINNVQFVFTYTPVDPLQNSYIEWNYLFILDTTIQQNILINQLYSPKSGITSMTKINSGAGYNIIFDKTPNTNPIFLYTYEACVYVDIPPPYGYFTYTFYMYARSIGIYDFFNPLRFAVYLDDGISYPNNPLYSDDIYPINFSQTYQFNVTLSGLHPRFFVCFYYTPRSMLPIPPPSTQFGVEWQYFYYSLPSVPGNSMYNKNISNTKSVGMNMINITTYKNNNFSPLSYNGSMVSIDQTTCYSVGLVSLILPNVLLKTGSRISFYPYVYVQLSNATSPNKASTEIIYSNNPNSTRALFIAPVNQILNPEENTFLTLYGAGEGMPQLIKFKPNDNFIFSVYLPDGSPFETLDIDTLPPYQPNPSLQIDAVFSLTRMNQSENQMMFGANSVQRNH